MIISCKTKKRKAWAINVVQINNIFIHSREFALFESPAQFKKYTLGPFHSCIYITYWLQRESDKVAETCNLFKFFFISLYLILWTQIF